MGIKNYYNSIAGGYNELYKEEQIEKLEKIYVYIKDLIKYRSLLLDVGAGTGISTEFFKEKFGCLCVALDPSWEMLKQYEGNKVIGNAENLPFKNNMFDVVVSVTALHHCDIDKAIKEMLRVVKKDGIIIVTLLKKSNKKLKGYKEIDIGKDWLYLIKHKI